MNIKKLHILFPVVLLAAMLTGCTLYMDEEDLVPEEERGFDEAVHVQNDTVDVTYQFNEGTRNLTAHVQEYLVRVEADSILYFMDNTPQDYLPFTGGYVFSEVTDKLPWGLMHYVESAQYTSGFYKVVCRSAGIKEVFKKFKLTIDRPVDYSKARMIDTNPDSLGVPMLDSLPVWDLDESFNYAEYDNEGNLISGPSQSRATRSDDSDGSKDRKETSTFSFGFDSRNIVGGEMPDEAGWVAKCMYGRCPDWLKGGMHFRGKKKNKFLFGGKDIGVETYKNFYWTFKYTYTNTETTHVVIDSDKDMFEYYVDDETTHSLALEIGYQLGAEKQCKPGRALFDKMKKSKQTELLQTVDGPEVAIPLWGPVSLVINTSIDFDLHINACGRLSWSYTTLKRKGVSYLDGNLQRTDKNLKENGSNKVDFELCGEAKAEISAHFGVGIRVGKGITLDATFGGYVAAGVEAHASVSLQEIVNDNGERQPISDRNYLRSYVKAGLEIGLKIAFIGKSLYDEKYPVGKELILAESKTNPYPVIDYKGTKIINLSGDDSSEFDFSDADIQMKMKYKELGFMYNVCGWKFSPYVELFNSNTGKSLGRFFPNEATTSMWPLVNDKNHVYVYDFPGLSRDVLYKIVPHLVYDGCDYVYNDQKFYFSTTSPSIHFSEDGLKQVYSNSLETGTNYYDIVANLNIQGASDIQSWGIKVVVKNSKGTQILSKEYDLKRAKSKNYNILVTLFSSSKSGQITITPYATVIGRNGATSKKTFASKTAKYDVTDEGDLFEKLEQDYDFSFSSHAK